MIGKSAPASSATFLAALLTASCLAAGARAQNPPAAPAAPAPPAASQQAVKPDPYAAFLAKARALYYSSSNSGLKGFDCAVHPEWRTLFLSAQQDGAAVAAVADDDPRILLLKTVKITLHGRLTGGSSLDWSPPQKAEKPLDADSTDMLDTMHKAAERTLTGFMQFWSPFVDGSVIPASSEGLKISHTEKGHTIFADQDGTALTEVLDNDLVMQQFNVVTGGAKIDFSPRYKPTDQGLLVSAFLAHIQGPSDTPDKAEEMHVEIEYQTVSGFPIPARIRMEMPGNGKFNYALDGCTANPAAN